MKIALIGSNGLLGSSIKKHLKQVGIDTLLLTHDKFEITNVKDYEVIREFQADVVINTAAYLGVECCEERPLDAFSINTKAVGDLARFCNTEDIVLVQVSTDGVFDGTSGNYNENSNPKPVNLYGLTKYNAEQLVINLCKKYYVFRIPILFGKRENTGNIFIEKMYSLYLNGHKELSIADDVINRPSYSCDIAKKLIDTVMEHNEFGLYHIFNGGPHASLYDFASEFFRLKGINNINLIKAKASDFSAGEKGVKPLDTTLDSVKLTPLRDWSSAMEEFISQG